MYLAIIVLPLLGSIVSGFFGRKVGVNGAQFLSSICVVITTLFSIAVFFEVALNNISVSLYLFRWVDVELLNVSWGFNFDSLTVSMLIPVLIISSLVHIYSIGYMSHDPHNQRFFSYLSLFTFMMVILVTANNFLLMFVGWEGVGVCSYLLVNFWFTRIAANQSSLSAFLTNRVGDCFLTIGMFIILLTFGNLDYSTVFSLAPFVSEDSVTIIGICLLIGAMAKSSQFGLHVWLPLAMEGPTPVSALIHAATMVTAGVYLLMRTSPLIEYSSTVLLTCLWIGSVTTVFSSLIGLFQQDIKKVIAYSTMSQLGMMVIAVGLSSYNIALFHLINHAFYKGLLFLGAGAVIHSIADNQDFRRYGGFIMFLPLSYTVMLIASLSLVAFPFMTGFYSKDFILESSFAQYTYSGTAVYYTALIGAIFTTLYSVKVLYLTFIAGASAPVINYNSTHESNIYMSLPLIILALFSIFFGFFTKDAFIGLGSGLFTDNSLFIHPLHETIINSEFGVPYTFKLLPFVLTTLVSVISLIILEFYPKVLLNLTFTRVGYNIFNFLNLRFLIEYIYNKYVAYFILNIGSHTTKILDKGSIEKIGPYGLEKILIMLSKNLNTLSTGVVTTYALYILIGFILYVSLPYILIDSHILILMIFCSVLYTINFDKKTINYTISDNNNSIPYTTVKTSSTSSTAIYVIAMLASTCWAMFVLTDPSLNHLSVNENDEISKAMLDFFSDKANCYYQNNNVVNVINNNVIDNDVNNNNVTNNNVVNITHKTIPIEHCLDQTAQNLSNLINHKYMCIKHYLFGTEFNVTNNNVVNITHKTIPIEHCLDQTAQNLSNKISDQYTRFEHYIFSTEFKNYVLSRKFLKHVLIGSCVVLTPLVIYKCAQFDFDFNSGDVHENYEVHGMRIPFTNIRMFDFFHTYTEEPFQAPNEIGVLDPQRAQAIAALINPENPEAAFFIPHVFETEIVSRHICHVWNNHDTNAHLILDAMRIDRYTRDGISQGYNSLDIHFNTELLTNPYIIEFMWNFTGIAA